MIRSFQASSRDESRGILVPAGDLPDGSTVRVRPVRPDDPILVHEEGGTIVDARVRVGPAGPEPLPDARQP